ncbi:hypothetical protein [Paenarthrobacter sp. NPDC090522]|uniref:hypothetical protein n=1 Tax=Paenarthrobacter sp. NPDC090522 TaxID=3364383 RepID=UPI00380307B6
MVLLALATLAGALSSCAQSPTSQALEGPLKEAVSAVRTTALAVDLRIKEHTTAAAGSTAADDMVKQLESATDEVGALSGATSDERKLREDVLATFSTASRAMLHARDALTAPQGGPEDGQSGSGESKLAPVLDELHSASRQLDALMAKAGIQ